MDLKVFYSHLKWNIKQISVLAGHAENVKGKARSGYYKAAIIIAASVVEALAYKLLELNNDLPMPLDDWRCTRSELLSGNYIAVDGSRLSICARAQPTFKLDKFTDFKKVNEVSLKLNIFTNRFFKKIDKVRVLRNKIHIQGLNSSDKSYTKKELEFVSSVMSELLDKTNHQIDLLIAKIKK
jgi:hypothetical protein